MTKTKNSHFDVLPHCPMPHCPMCSKAAESKVRLGEGPCFGCMSIRATLARMNRLNDHAIYKRIQWLSAADALIREATLEQVEHELTLEAAKENVT